MADPLDAPEIFARLKKEIAKVVVGQDDVIEKIFIALLCRGHVLLVGAPGLAKTTLVQSFAKALDLPFGRIQFTPDLMPADILGTEILQEDRSTGRKEHVFVKGPVFTQILLADEINRTPPKTQAALLQAMQEGVVTVYGKTEKLSSPFMVLATQNPIEQEGTYPLPEAQLDRFLFSLDLGYPSPEQELAIAKLHSSQIKAEIGTVLNRHEIMALQEKAMALPVADHVYACAVKCVRATRPDATRGNKSGAEEKALPQVNRFIQWGAGPRAVQTLLMGAKAKALLAGRPTPLEADIRDLLYPVLNHRLHFTFEAEAENVRMQTFLPDLMEKVFNTL